MTQILLSTFNSMLLHALILPVLTMLQAVLGGLLTLQTSQIGASWVAQAAGFSATVAGGLLGLLVAYRALTAYILWNEGTDDTADPGFFKNALRVSVYGAIGIPLVWLVTRFGILLALGYMSTPILGLTQRFATEAAMPMPFFDQVGAATVGGVGAALFTMLIILVLVVGLLVVTIQMAIRSVELAVMLVAAPIVALGWINPNGGLWQNWWQKLLTLTFATALQLFCLKGLLFTVTTVSPSGGVGAGPWLALLLSLAWAWVAVAGPHMMRDFAYRTGLASRGQTIVGARMSRR